MSNMEQSLDALLRNEYIALVADMAEKQRVSAYFVGGGLRDVLTGRGIKDFDFVLTGALEELPAKFAQTIGGTFFWLDRVRQQTRVVRKNNNVSLAFDFAPLRGGNINDDLLLRDFTVNALALPLVTGNVTLVDPLQGMADLRRMVIKACSENSFDDDPLRLLRALRFAATLDFTIDTSTWSKICDKAHLLRKAASERIRDEFFQILTAPRVGSSLTKLYASGLLTEIFPASLFMTDAGYSANNGRASMEKRIGHAAAVEEIPTGCFPPDEAPQLRRYLYREVEARIPLVSLIKLAAFLGETDDPRQMTAVIGERLRIGCKACRILGMLCERNENLFSVLGQNPTKRSMYRFFRDREPAGLALIVLALDRESVPRELGAELVGYYFREFPTIQDDMLLSGDEIMTILGIGPGCQVGEARKRLRDAECAGLVNDKAEATAFLEKNLLTRKEPLL
jgi:poly(A) polymerase